MSGKRISGFTLIELMIVLLIVSILAAVISPVVVNSIDKGRESALKEDLYILRKTLDDYYADKGRYPDMLMDLVDEGYIRSLPRDPFTESSDGWAVTRDEEGGVSDIHSSYEGQGKDGSFIREW